MNESTFPGTEHVTDHLSGRLPGHQPTPEPAQPFSTPPRPVTTPRALPDNYAEMPKPTAKLTAEDLAPVNDPNGPRHKIGPTGRPLPDLPVPATRQNRSGAGDRDVQPEGRRR